MMTNELLRRYAADGSESAFTELVRQHIDLVYSAALRQVQGDIGAAQDVTQAVFTDLARKAPRLAGHPSLTGWLYTSARFEASKSRRAEQRRRTREQESHAMSELLQIHDPGDTWQDMRPVLDDVMHELNDADREAVLLRYFERKPLAEIGARLGLSENTARMRVDRALEKLRRELSKRGVTSTGAALALALTEGAVSAAPGTMVSEVSKSALSAAAVGVGVGTGILKFAGPSVMKWYAVAAALAVASLALWTRHRQPVQTAEAQAPIASQSPAAIALSTTPVPTAAFAAAPSPPLDGTNKLTLHIMTADSGQPIPSVDLDYWVWERGEVHHRKSLHANRLGVCEVPVPRDTVTKLILVSQREGFADTRLQWHTDQGEKIPEEYTLRVPRSTPIGGTVVDADGNPVPGAKIGFNNRNDPSTVTDPASELLIETSDFGWPFWIETTSDSTGHWHINRIARETIHTLEGGADEPAHVADNVYVGNNLHAEKQLLAGNYIFHLGRAIEVRGEVTDLSGTPIPEARVWAGYDMSGSRETKTGRKGTFSIAGCKPAKTPLSVDAKGFATTTIEVDLSTNRSAFHLVLQHGKLVRIRVVDADGNPIANARVSLDIRPRFELEVPPVQADFENKTDADGRVEWDSAPDGELNFEILAEGHNGASVQIKADSVEHVVTLDAPSPALTLFGSVTDASTGNLLPSFRIIVGWPERDLQTGEVGHSWSTLVRFWLKFDRGTFRHRFDGPPLARQPNPGFIFKFEADGYAPVVTRSFTGDEGESRLDVAMQPATPTSITVLLPDGQAAAKAEVGLVWHGSGLRLRPGGFAHGNRQSLESLFSTDETGHLSLFSEDVVKKIVIAHPQGFGQTTPASLSNNTIIQLQPWSRVEGTLLCDGQPAPGREIKFDFGDGDYRSISTDFDAFKVTTDGAGRFVFPQVPPGDNQLVLIVPVGPGRLWTSRTLTNLDVPPGETITLTTTTTIAAGSVVSLPSSANRAQ